jgi:hypothetical protein
VGAYFVDAFVNDSASVVVVAFEGKIALVGSVVERIAFVVDALEEYFVDAFVD